MSTMTANTASVVSCPGNELTRSAFERMQETFKARKHHPSDEMLEGLYNLQKTLTSMLYGEAEPCYYLSSLDPGVGKTTAICKWLEVYLENIDLHERPGVLIGLERLEEIRALVSEANLSEHSYAVLVSENTQGGPDLNACGLGVNRIAEAQILFTTKAQLRLRTEGRNFHRVDSLFFQGEPRRVRVWDESLVVGKPLTLSRGQIAKLIEVLDKKGHGGFVSEVLKIMNDLEQMKDDGDVFQMPELNVTPGQFAGFFRDASKAERDVAEVFAVMAGRVVTVRTDNRFGGILVDCEDSLPEDFAPCLVTDASARIRETYRLQHKYRRDVIYLPPAGSVKRYDNLEVRVWSRGSGKSFYQNNGTEATAKEVAKVIMSRPEEKFLVIYLKDCDLDRAIRMKLDSKDNGRVEFLTLGKHTATNDYHDIPNVIIAGMLNYRTADYEAMARASASRRTSEGPMDDAEVKSMVKAEAAHHVLQAACRGLVRKANGNQCPESRLWFIDSPHTGIKDLLPHLFPGCKVTEWETERKPLSGQRKEGLRLILEAVERGEREISASLIRKVLKMGASNFRTCIINNQDFRDALAEHSIEPDRRGNRWWFEVHDGEYYFPSETF